MSALSFIYRQSLVSRRENHGLARLRAKCFHWLRKLILQVANPPCRMTVWGRSMWMTFAHPLPTLLRCEEQYDRLVMRAAAFIRSRQGHLCGIDVGANIGDTIAACSVNGNDTFLALEPNPVYFELLERNLGEFPNVRRLKIAGAEVDSDALGAGAPGQTGPPMKANRLDTLVRQYPEFARCNFLKIDTDGHDFEVLRGAKELIKGARPAVLFESQVWTNANYVTDVLEALKLFADAGYTRALVYDNTGYLQRLLDLQAPSWIPQALFFEVASRKCYYDILVLPDAESFLQQELEYFVRLIPEPECRAAAEHAARLVSAAWKSNGAGPKA